MAILLNIVCCSFTSLIWIEDDIAFERVEVMVFSATFNNISVLSWRPVLLLEETGVPGENQRPVASH